MITFIFSKQIEPEEFAIYDNSHKVAGGWRTCRRWDRRDGLFGNVGAQVFVYGPKYRAFEKFAGNEAELPGVLTVFDSVEIVFGSTGSGTTTTAGHRYLLNEK